MKICIIFFIIIFSSNLCFSQQFNPTKDYEKAYQLLISYNYFQAKQSFKNFITKYQDNKYMGAAYFWLGEIYLLEEDYSKAVLIYAEGYQKFPKSFHASITLVQMSEALIRLDKLNEACKTLNIVAKDFSNDEIIMKKVMKKISSFECTISAKEEINVKKEKTKKDLAKVQKKIVPKEKIIKNINGVIMNDEVKKQLLEFIQARSNFKEACDGMWYLRKLNNTPDQEILDLCAVKPNSLKYDPRSKYFFSETEELKFLLRQFGVYD